MKNITRKSPAFLLALLLLGGCQAKEVSTTESALKYKQNFELTGTEKKELIGPIHSSLFTKVDRKNLEAKTVSIPDVPKEGKTLSLPTGRYMITGNPTGNIYLFDADGNQLLREIVGDYAGATSLTVSVDDSFSIRVDGGYDSVQISPAPTSLSTALTAGIWEVGVDITPGVYSISLNEEYGYLQILEKGKDPILYELLGGSAALTKSTVQLSKGQLLRITDTSMMLFTPARN